MARGKGIDFCAFERARMLSAVKSRAVLRKAGKADNIAKGEAIHIRTQHENAQKRENT